MFIDYIHTFELEVVKSTLYFLFQLMTVSEYKVFYKRMSGLEKVRFLLPLMLCIPWHSSMLLKLSSAIPWFNEDHLHPFKAQLRGSELVCFFLVIFNFFAEAFFIRVVAPWCFTGLISQICQKSLNLLIQIARWLDRGKCSLYGYAILLIFILRILYQRRLKGVTRFVPTSP